MSERSSSESEMSSLAEMHALVHEAADYAAPGGNWKERVQAAARVLNLGWERSKAFYYRDARRVDAEEMDNARAAIRELREAKRRQKDARHLAWLREQIERHRESGDELRGVHIDALEHFLRVAGDPAGSVEIPDSASDPEDFTD